jgi:hypothetical protein
MLLHSGKNLLTLLNASLLYPILIHKLKIEAMLEVKASLKRGFNIDSIKDTLAGGTQSIRCDAARTASYNAGTAVHQLVDTLNAWANCVEYVSRNT